MTNKDAIAQTMGWVGVKAVEMPIYPHASDH